MHKFKISADLSSSLGKQQTQLSVTTAVSAFGLLIVLIANAVTEIHTPELEAPEEGEST
jgi:hypothetical protein